MAGNCGQAIRTGRADDAVTIGEIHAAAWAAGFAHLFDAEFLSRLVARRRTMWAGMFENLQMRATTLLLAEVKDEPVAFVHFGPAGVWDEQERVGQGEIYGFYAHPSVWGTGAAGRLMTAALAQLTKSGLDPVSLWTLEGVSRARHFYAKNGFSPTGRNRTVDFGDGRPRTEVEYRH